MSRYLVSFVLMMVMGVSVSYGVNNDSQMDTKNIIMETTGLVITQNRIGVGVSLPGSAVHVNGGVFLKNTVTYDYIEREPYTVDWTLANCQRMTITTDGPSGITLGNPPSNNAHLTLSIDYNTDTPGKTTFSVADPTKYALVWSCDVSNNIPISHNIDVVHFYYQKGPVISTYNGFATFWYRVPE
ncbi:hypothetical protein EBR57_02900 [bacterium]|nr:hypothetical protein [bacterium]